MIVDATCKQCHFDCQVDAATEYEVARVGRPKTQGSGPLRSYRWQNFSKVASFASNYPNLLEMYIIHIVLIVVIFIVSTHILENATSMPPD